MVRWLPFTLVTLAAITLACVLVLFADMRRHDAAPIPIHLVQPATSIIETSEPSVFSANLQQPAAGVAGPLDAIEARIDRRLEQRLGEVADGLEGKASGTVGGVWAEVIVRIVAAIKKLVIQALQNAVDDFIWTWVKSHAGIISAIVMSLVGIVAGPAYLAARLGRGRATT